jgi:hypothetical protein
VSGRAQSEDILIVALFNFRWKRNVGGIRAKSFDDRTLNALDDLVIL